MNEHHGSESREQMNIKIFRYLRQKKKSDFPILHLYIPQWHDSKNLSNTSTQHFHYQELAPQIDP